MRRRTFVQAAPGPRLASGARRVSSKESVSVSTRAPRHDAARRRMSQLGSEMAVISGWLVICFFAALALFRWK